MKLSLILLICAATAAYCCSTQADCPVNTVCYGSCRGIQGGSCSGSSPCASGYNCVSGTCLNSASNAFHAASQASSCSSAPVIGCNTTANIAFRESNVLTSTLSCSNPTTTYPAGTAVAMFYLPPTNNSWDELDVQFYLSSAGPPAVNVHVLTPCGSGFCDRKITPVEVVPALWSWRHTYDYNNVGTVRGYMLATNAQLPAPSGLKIDVAIQCSMDLDYTEIPNSNQCPVTTSTDTCTGDAECYSVGSRSVGNVITNQWGCRVPQGKRCKIGGTPCEGTGLTCRQDAGVYKCLPPANVQPTMCIIGVSPTSPYFCDSPTKECIETGYQSDDMCYSKEGGPCDSNDDCAPGRNLACYTGTCTDIGDIPACPSATQMRAVYAPMRECYRNYLSSSNNPNYNPLCWNIDPMMGRSDCCKNYANAVCPGYAIPLGASPRPGYDLTFNFKDKAYWTLAGLSVVNDVCEARNHVRNECGYDFHTDYWGINGDNYPLGN